MPEPPYRPLDAQVIPRFAGIRTFMRAPHVTDLAGVDAAVYGIQFDTATSYRTGARIAVLTASVGATPDAGDFLALFDHDVAALVRALSGTAG